MSASQRPPRLQSNGSASHSLRLLVATWLFSMSTVVVVDSFSTTMPTSFAIKNTRSTLLTFQPCLLLPPHCSTRDETAPQSTKNTRLSKGRTTRSLLFLSRGHDFNPAKTSSSSRLAAMSDDNSDEFDNSIPNPKPPSINNKADIVVAETSLALKRASWLSWWSQMILTVTSGIILGFANNVVVSSSSTMMGLPQVNFVLAGTGIAVSFLSIFWTWGGGARLSRRLLRRPTSRIQTANMVRRAIRVGVTLNLIGMLLTLLGAEQTVGVLAIKVLTTRPWNNPLAAVGGAGYDAGLQPLDILVVQANTNILLSHFCSLVSLLYLTRFVNRLDPPSTDEDDSTDSTKKRQ